MLSPTDLVVAQLALRMTAPQATRHVNRRRNHMALPQDRCVGPMHGTCMRRVPFETHYARGRRATATPQTRGLLESSKYAAKHSGPRSPPPLFSANYRTFLALIGAESV